ncbi:MAG: amidohydrolase family protein [Solirubrobacteraceae bacterium]|nr:amidohydrolase family protein [Solirubrobacteraceae bacterium]
MSRKGVLSAAALSASALVLRSQSARAAGAAPPGGGASAPVVDVHGHAITAALESQMQARGSRLLDGRELPTWDAASARSFMDRQGIDLQLLSTPDPALSFVDEAGTVGAARAVNDELADVVASAPARFGALAVLPLRAGPGPAITELRRATDRLGMDGVVLPTGVAGRLLGDPVYMPVLAELSRRRIPALVHPVAPGVDARPEHQGATADTLEHAFASVRCAASLLYGGAFLRAPHLRLVFGAGGGGLPFVASRVALADQALQAELFIRPLRRLSFDLAQSTAPGAVRSMRAFVRSPSQLLYGSDWPLVPEQSLAAALDAVTLPDQLAVRGAAALRLFPRLASRLRLPPAVPR